MRLFKGVVMELYQQGGFVALVTYLLMIKLKKKVSKKYLPVVSICLACTLNIPEAASATVALFNVRTTFYVLFATRNK